MMTFTRRALACLIATSTFGIGVSHAGQNPIGLTQDWSSNSIIYHQAKTPDELIAANQRAAMNRYYQDPRYVSAALTRLARQTGPLSQPPIGIRAILPRVPPSPTPQIPRIPGTDGPISRVPTMRDWSAVLGGGTDGQGGTGMEGVYPAKYNFDVFAAPSCANDFVVYPINAAAAAQSGNKETWTGTFNSNPGTGNTVTIGPAGVRQVVLTASNNNNTGTNFQTNGNNTERATNLAAAINRFTSQTGFSATSNNASVTITINTTGNTSNGAVSEGLRNFSLSNTNGSGTPGQASIVAYNQLYQGSCPGTWNQNGAVKAPRVMWAYTTGAGYQVETSPVLSYHDGGKQVAYVQRSGTTLQLVLLKWKDGDGTPWNPVAATDMLSDLAGYRACTGGCYIRFTLTTGGQNSATWSSPFVDYANDQLWVGDNNGVLYGFSGVFKGNPARINGNNGTTIATGMKLSPPAVYNGNVYIGSQSGGTGVGGMLHRYNIASGTLYSSAKLATNNSIGLRARILIDTTSNSVFGFLFNDGSAGDGTNCTATGGGNPDSCRVIARFATGFANGDAPVQRAYVGRGNSTVSTLFEGSFDDAYYSSSNATGYMYIVGGEPADTYVPRLWRIPLTNGAFGNPLIGPTLGPKTCSTIANCAVPWNWSPVTVAKNGSAEYLYMSMPSSANLGGCSGACLFLFNLSGNWNGSKGPAASLAAPGGTGGIIYDNFSHTTGASQIYFFQTGATGNAIQAAQNNLK